MFCRKTTGAVSSGQAQNKTEYLKRGIFTLKGLAAAVMTLCAVALVSPLSTPAEAGGGSKTGKGYTPEIQTAKYALQYIKVQYNEIQTTNKAMRQQEDEVLK